MCLRRLGGGGGVVLGGYFSLSREPPPPTTALVASPSGTKFRALFITLLLELKLEGNGPPGDGQTCDPLMPVHVLERSRFFKMYAKMSGNRLNRAILGVVFFAEIAQYCSKFVPGASGSQN